MISSFAGKNNMPQQEHNNHRSGKLKKNALFLKAPETVPRQKTIAVRTPQKLHRSRTPCHSTAPTPLTYTMRQHPHTPRSPHHNIYTAQIHHITATTPLTHTTPQHVHHLVHQRQHAASASVQCQVWTNQTVFFLDTHGRMQLIRLVHSSSCSCKARGWGNDSFKITHCTYICVAHSCNLPRVTSG